MIMGMLEPSGWSWPVLVIICEIGGDAGDKIRETVMGVILAVVKDIDKGVEVKRVRLREATFIKNVTVLHL